MAYRAVRFPGGRRLLAADLLDRYDLGRTFLAGQVAANPALSLMELVGHVELDDLDLDPRSGAGRPAGGLSRVEPEIHGVLIAGDLVVSGAIHQARAPIGLSLYVLGDVRAGNVAVSGMELVVTGATAVREAFCGSGPHGGARLDGGLRARLLISDGFPMLISGPLESPVLDAGSPRIGVQDGGAVRAQYGDAPPDVVLDRRVFDPRVPGGGFNFERLQSLLESGESPLSEDYRTGRTDLTIHRELRWLDKEIRDAARDGRYVVVVELLKATRNRGARSLLNSLQLADALYRTHQPTGDRQGLSEALSLLEETLGAQPDPAMVAAHPEALAQRAAIRLQLAEQDDTAFELALADCTLAAPALPERDRPALARMLGRWLFGRRRYAESVPYVRQALTGNDDDGAMHGCLARALWMLDGELEAVPHATRSLELNPSDDRMWFVRGKCHQVLGDVGRARLDLQTHLDLHPDDVLTVEALMELALDQDQVELAVDRALQFVTAFPDDEDAPGRLGRLLHARGLFGRAVPFLRRAVELEPERATSVVELAVALTQSQAAGGDSAGLATALRLAEMDPGGDHLTYVRGECMLALGDDARAAADLSAYVARFPRAARALASLALVEARQGRPMIAARLLEKAESAAPEDVYIESITDLVRGAGVSTPR